MAFRVKNKYKFQPNKSNFSRKLEPGITGFLCTCNGKFREKDCLRESYSILNEYADILFGPQVQIEEKESEQLGSDIDGKLECDIDDALAKEVQLIKEEVKKKPDFRRFQVIESGANGIVFVKTTVPDPVKLAHTIATNYSKGVQKSKFVLRLLPVEVTCKAYLDDIKKAVEPLLEKNFSGEAKTFAIIFNHRNNDRVKRDEVIQNVAELVFEKNGLHKADLKQPDLVILVEIIRSICCISVVPDYYSLKKYNLLENALKGSENTNSVHTECGEGADSIK